MNNKIAEADWPQKSREISQLLARSGLGDRAAFSRLYERTSSQLLAVVLRIQRDRALAEDLLQEVYVNVWKAAGAFDATRSQPLTWLTSIARNRAIDSLRRAQTQPALLSVSRDDGNEDEGPDAIERTASDEPDPLELLDRACHALELHRCIDGLSSTQRQCVALAFFDGLSHTEVAAHLHEPLGTVKSWLRRGLATLKDCLDAAVARGSAVAAASTARGA